MPPELSTSWSELLSPQARRLVLFMLSHPALEAALRSPWTVDVSPRGAGDGLAPLLPDTISLELAGDPAGAAQLFDRLDGDQPCILLRNVLQHLPDYRSFIARAFDRLRDGGHLIVIVPHQFLYERKLQVPSRYERRHLRFYTPGALLAEIEEALDPCRYRVRLLADHDGGFDYRAPLGEVPAGGHEIVLCLQKLPPPPWREAMEQDEVQSAVFPQPTRFPAPYDGEEDGYRVIAPDNRAIRRLVVLKLDHRGDFMMATPAFRILRQAFPDAEITLVCGSWNRREAEDLGLFGEVVPFDFYPEDASAGWPAGSDDDRHQRFAELVAGREWDMAIDLRLYDDTRALLKAVSARHKAGFDRYEAFPWLTIPMAPLIPTVDGRAEQGMVPASAFSTDVGEHRGFAIVFAEGGTAGGGEVLVYGPYLDLVGGHYDLELLIEPLAEDFRLNCRLTAGGGARVLHWGALPVARGQAPRLSLDLAEPAAGFEFCLLPDGPGRLPPFRLLGLSWRHRGAFVGMHQREMMALLAHLVALRLQHPYAVTSR